MKICDSVVPTINHPISTNYRTEIKFKIVFILRPIKSFQLFISWVLVEKFLDCVCSCFIHNSLYIQV